MKAGLLQQTGVEAALRGQALPHSISGAAASQSPPTPPTPQDAPPPTCLVLLTSAASIASVVDMGSDADDKPPLNARMSSASESE